MTRVRSRPGLRNSIGGDGNRSGRSGKSDSSSSMYSNSETYENDEIDVICDEDLADADEDISLGIYKSVKDLPLGASEFPVRIDSQHTMPKGYIDDAIEDDILRSADDRLKRKNSFSIKKKVAVGIIGVTAFLVIIMGQASFENKRIEKSIKDKSTAFKFDDHDEFIKSVTETTETETTEAGKIKTETTVTTTKTEKTVEIMSILEDQIPLDYNTVFPLAMEQFLVDPRITTIDKLHETPLFWQVPFVGGVFQNFMTGCSKKVLASTYRLTDDDTMKIHMVRQNPYVNVNLSTNEGIENAAKQGLAKSGLADVIVSNHVNFITGALFDNEHKGRLFTAMQHPVDRFISEYYYIVSTEPSKFSGFVGKSISLEEFVSSKFSDKNWMTRFLIGKWDGSLEVEDLQLAKEILRKRCLIGLHDHIELSINLFEKYFGWTVEEKDVHSYNTCKQEIISHESVHAREIYEHVGKIEQGSEVYNKIVEFNKFDMELYWYANDLFNEQQSWVAKKN